jgi:hypothetical protein
VTNSSRQEHDALRVPRRQLTQDVVRLLAHPPEQLVDEFDERAPQTPAYIQRPEGGQRHDSDAVCPARASRHRPAVVPEWQVGDDDREVPVAPEQAAARALEDVGDASRRLHQPVDDQLGAPVDRRVPPGEILSELLGELWRHISLEPRRHDDAERHDRAHLAPDRFWLRDLLSRVGGLTRLHFEVKLTLEGVDVHAVARVDLPAENKS